jgi:hypothetical protein
MKFKTYKLKNGDIITVLFKSDLADDRLCGLVVRVLGYKSRGSGSIPGSTRFSEM